MYLPNKKIQLEQTLLQLDAHGTEPVIFIIVIIFNPDTGRMEGVISIESGNFYFHGD